MRKARNRANQVNALKTHQLQVKRRECHRANQVNALKTHQLQVERRESHRANQVYALTTYQLQVERRESHRANQVDGVGVLDWPENSPDLNPIEKLWVIVMRKMRNKRPKNADELN